MAHRPNSLVIRSRVETKTQAQKEIFINTLKKLLNVSVAIEVTGLSRYLVYQWRKEDSIFKEQWDDAIAFASGSLESAAYLKLAKELTSNKALSMPAEKLVEFMLAGNMPDKYKQANRIEIDNRQMNITIDWSKIPDDMLARYNAHELTMQDIYEYYIALQSKEQARSDTSED